MTLTTLLVIIHVIGVAFGAGGATISDLMFFRAVRDKRIDAKEYDFLKLVSKVVWTGFFVLVLSGAAMLFLEATEVADHVDHGHVDESEEIFTPKVISKIGISTVILLNGLFMHTMIFPLFKRRLNKRLIVASTKKSVWPIAISGAISIVSWYSALILGAWRGVSDVLSLAQIALIYFVLLVGAMLVAHAFAKKHCT